MNCMRLAPTLLTLTALALNAACRPVRVSSQTSSEEARSFASSSADSSVQTPLPITCPSSAPLAIVGGQKSEAEQLAARASVKIWIKSQRFCTGTLLGPHHIVTAAHCLRDEARIEDIRLGFGVEGTVSETVQVTGFQMHPRFVGIPSQTRATPQAALYDVAVLSFIGTLPASAQAVALAKPEYLSPGLSVLSVGYGAYASDDKQRRPLSQVELKLDEVFPDQRELQLERGAGKGACFGDSGGPTYLVGEGGSCLLLIGSTTGPGRRTAGTCESGGGTLMDLTRYQGWMRCAFESLGTPLESLITDASLEQCR